MSTPADTSNFQRSAPFLVLEGRSFNPRRLINFEEGRSFVVGVDLLLYIILHIIIISLFILGLKLLVYKIKILK